MASKYHPNALTLPDAWDQAITMYGRHQKADEHFSPRTVKADHDALAHLGRRIGKGPWDVTYLDLIEFFAEQDWAPNTKKTRRRAFVNFYDWAIDLELFTAANPARRMKVPRVPEGVSKPTPEDIYELALQLEPRRDIRLMLRIAGETGLRRSEYAMTRREDLIQTRDGWDLAVPHGKGEKRRVVQCPPYLAAMIRDHVSEGYLFPGRTGGYVSPGWAGRMVARALRRAGWDGTGHGLRHKTANDLMRDTDNDILAVKFQLGHKNMATTEGYIVKDMGKLRRVMNARTSSVA